MSGVRGHTTLAYERLWKWDPEIQERLVLCSMDFSGQKLVMTVKGLWRMARKISSFFFQTPILLAVGGPSSILYGNERSAMDQSD